MSTSEPLAHTSSPMVAAREAAGVGLVVAALTAAFAHHQIGLGIVPGIVPHIGWAVVLVLSARHGGRGFGFGLLAGAATVALTALVLGTSPVAAMKAIGSSTPDLMALVVSMLVAGVASTRERRLAQLAGQSAALAKKSEDDDVTVAALRDAAVALRARADRLDHCLTFVRDVATRLEGDDPARAGQAALDLALARTAAEAGVVLRRDGERLRPLASLGEWTPEGTIPADPLVDRTVKAAFAGRTAVRAADVADAGPDDADVAAPVLDEAGEVWGVLALRGVPDDSLRHALVHDVGLIARWCAKSLGARRPGIEERDEITATTLVTQRRARLQSVN